MMHNVLPHVFILMDTWMQVVRGRRECINLIWYADYSAVSEGALLIFLRVSVACRYLADPRR